MLLILTLLVLAEVRRVSTWNGTAGKVRVNVMRAQRLVLLGSISFETIQVLGPEGGAVAGTFSFVHDVKR